MNTRNTLDTMPAWIDARHQQLSAGWFQCYRLRDEAATDEDAQVWQDAGDDFLGRCIALTEEWSTPIHPH